MSQETVLTRVEINWLAIRQHWTIWGRSNRFSINIHHRPESLIEKLIYVPRFDDISYFRLKEEFWTDINKTAIEKRQIELEALDD